MASYLGHLETLEELLRGGADPNKAMNNGQTPLEAVRRKGHSRIVQFLQEHGAHA